MNKKEVYEALMKEIQARGAEMQLAWDELLETNKQEGKSSAGDKHETSAAQVHLELEKMGKQMQEHNKKREELERFHPDKSMDSDRVRSGSLVNTSLGWFYLIVSFGKFTVNSNECFVVSAASPIGSLLLGKKVGEEFLWNGRDGEVLKVL